MNQSNNIFAQGQNNPFQGGSYQQNTNTMQNSVFNRNVNNQVFQQNNTNSQYGGYPNNQNTTNPVVGGNIFQQNQANANNGNMNSIFTNNSNGMNTNNNTLFNNNNNGQYGGGINNGVMMNNNNNPVPLIGSQRGKYELTKSQLADANGSTSSQVTLMSTSIIFCKGFQKLSVLLLRLEDYYLIRTGQLTDQDKQKVSSSITQNCFNQRLLNQPGNLQPPNIAALSRDIRMAQSQYIPNTTNTATNPQSIFTSQNNGQQTNNIYNNQQQQQLFNNNSNNIFGQGNNNNNSTNSIFSGNNTLNRSQNQGTYGNNNNANIFGTNTNVFNNNTNTTQQNSIFNNNRIPNNNTGNSIFGTNNNTNTNTNSIFNNNNTGNMQGGNNFNNTGSIFANNNTNNNSLFTNNNNNNLSTSNIFKNNNNTMNRTVTPVIGNNNNNNSIFNNNSNMNVSQNLNNNSIFNNNNLFKNNNTNTNNTNSIFGGNSIFSNNNNLFNNNSTNNNGSIFNSNNNNMNQSIFSNNGNIFSGGQYGNTNGNIFANNNNNNYPLPQQQQQYLSNNSAGYYSIQSGLYYAPLSSNEYTLEQYQQMKLNEQSEKKKIKQSYFMGAFSQTAAISPEDYAPAFFRKAIKPIYVTSSQDASSYGKLKTALARMGPQIPDSSSYGSIGKNLHSGKSSFVGLGGSNNNKLRSNSTDGMLGLTTAATENYKSSGDQEEYDSSSNNNGSRMISAFQMTQSAVKQKQNRDDFNFYHQPIYESKDKELEIRQQLGQEKPLLITVEALCFTLEGTEEEVILEKEIDTSSKIKSIGGFCKDQLVKSGVMKEPTKPFFVQIYSSGALVKDTEGLVSDLLPRKFDSLLQCEVIFEYDRHPFMRTSDFQVSPSLEQLQALSTRELKSVSGFTVEGYFGKLEWLNPVDLRDLDIDKTIAISDQQITVYPEADFPGSTKPNIGSGINGRCQITYKNASVLTGKVKSGEVSLDVIKSLIEKQCKTQGVELLYFDDSALSWTIIAPHFSVYAFQF